jgi:hypothetical protein
MGARRPRILVEAVARLHEVNPDLIIMRESYKTLGVDDFFNLRDEVVRHGKEAALERLRDCVLGRLPRFSAAAS